MTQGYPPYNDRESNQQPPPYPNQGQWQSPPPQGHHPQGQQMYQSPPPPGGYYPEKHEYYQPQHGYPGNQSQPPYPPQSQSYYPQQQPYGQPPQSYGQPPYSSPQPQYSQPGYPPQPQPPHYGQQAPQIPYSSYPGASAPPPQSEDERGILGALGGAAAGGFAGHKMGNHGIIGALGGAFAGHKLEDAYKHHNQKPSPVPSPQPPMYQQQHYGAPPPHQPQYSVGGLELRGNFSSSCTSITLDADYDLIASCALPGGGSKLSSVSLNQHITNDNGNFRWVSGGGNFGASARNVRLIEGGTVLEAELADVNGRWNNAKTWLNEKIGNVNGELKYVG